MTNSFSSPWINMPPDTQRRVEGETIHNMPGGATPDEVYALTRDGIAAGKAGGRFILSSGCCLGRDTPPASVDAMVRACEDFGVY